MTDTVLAPIVGESPAIKRATALIERFAPTGLPILLIGATGTGKELFARHIHFRSARRGPLVDINCGALPQEIADSLLFGHRRGAFTGAVETVAGHLERAHNGTLFLDEVLHLTAPAQVKLLRALETGEVQRLGEDHKHRVDFRIVSAAQEDTSDRLERGLFRHDLFQRLAGIVIELPVLADRAEDIVPLAEHFADMNNQVLEPGTAAVLQAHAWPGNVRELRLAIERAGCLVENGSVPAGAVRDAIALGVLCHRNRDRRTVERRASRRDRRQQVSRRFPIEEVLAACEAHGWDVRRGAASLGMGRSTMYETIKAAGLSLRNLRNSGSPEVQRNSRGLRDSGSSSAS